MASTAAFAQGAANAQDDSSFQTVSDAFSPLVRYSLTHDSHGVAMTIRVGAFAADGHGVHLTLGIQGSKSVLLTDADATTSYLPHEAIYRFSLKDSALGLTAKDDDMTLRAAFSIRWDGGPYGTPRLEQRYLQDGLALSGALSQDPRDWTDLNLKEQALLTTARRQRISFTLQQPMEGKVSIVIEDGQGKRLRNLLSGAPMTAGEHRIEWDGLDDQGNVVAPGEYRWRAIAHPGIVPHYLFSFANHGSPPWRSASPSSNWLADHSNAVAAASSGDRIYLGAPVAESGHNIVKVSPDGAPLGHVDFPTLVGIGKLFLLADETGVFAVMEGTPMYEPFHDGPAGAWSFRRPLNVLHWDLHEQPVSYGGPRGEKVVTENLYRGTGPHPSPREIPMANNLAGAAIVKHRIYISLRQENRIVVLDSDTGKPVSEIKLPEPGLLAADGEDSLVALSGKALVRIDVAKASVSQLFTPAMSKLLEMGDVEESTYGFVGSNPTGFAVDAQHNLYLSDNGVDQNVKKFSPAGKLLLEIGDRGGRPLGPWKNGAVYRPHGIALDRDGQLWVTETDHYPQRISVWNTASGRFLKQYVGPTRYGAPEGSFDVADHTHWIGNGALWKLDFDKKTAEPESVLFRQTKAGQMEHQMLGMYWNFYHQDGRTFLISYGNGQSIYELQKDGSMRLWAICGTLSSIAQFPRWTLPRAIVEAPAVQALMAANAKQNRASTALTAYGPWKDRVKLDERLLNNISILWVDRNGDGMGQPDEFEVLPAGDSFYAPGWGTGSPTLNLNMPARIKGKYVLLHLKPHGFLPSGAPDYSLKGALEAAVPLHFNPNAEGDGGQSIQDGAGREVFNSSPMRAVNAQGETLWTFPNRWVGVHGSHDAPLPRRGEMQGVLQFLGAAPLDAKGDVTVMNGNHGRFFAMTTDGIYLDEFFRDVRISQAVDAYRIGGEAFGGFFGRGEDGKYYLQSGHSDYRIFEVSGLREIKRLEGSLHVGAEQIAAVQRRLEHAQAESRQTQVALVPALPSSEKLPDDPERWPGSWEAVHWGDPAQPFPFAQVKILRSGVLLHLAYRVKDPSPWKNKGSDWTQLFKTGDSIDLQFSTDPNANAARTTPVAGDRRLLIAPFHQRSIAVLYDYRVAHAKAPMPFSSPWRTEQVDRVEELKNAHISVTTRGESYEVVASIPLEDLGLPASSQKVQLRGDFGVIYSDADGVTDQLRSYWSNKATGLVNDVPGEIMISPALWGTLNFEEAAQ